jgi:hypothetical protein
VIKTNHLNNGGRVFSDAKAKIRFHKQRRVGLITGFLKVGSSPIGDNISLLITTRISSSYCLIFVVNRVSRGRTGS